MQSLIAKTYFSPYQHALNLESIKLLFQPKITAKSGNYEVWLNTQSNSGITGWVCGLEGKNILRLYLLFVHVPSCAFES